MKRECSSRPTYNREKPISDSGSVHYGQANNHLEHGLLHLSLKAAYTGSVIIPNLLSLIRGALVSKHSTCCSFAYIFSDRGNGPNNLPISFSRPANSWSPKQHKTCMKLTFKKRHFFYLPYFFHTVTKRTHALNDGYVKVVPKSLLNCFIGDTCFPFKLLLLIESIQVNAL